MPANPLHREGNFDGEDSRGRLHGADAVQRLLNSTETGPDWNDGAPANFWDAADEVVEQADGLHELKDAALRHLLALHMFNLVDEHPKVAMRNVREGDIVELGGAIRKVVEKVGDGKRGHSVSLQAVLQHAPGVESSGVFRNGGDVRIGLLHRMSSEMGRRLFTEIVDQRQDAHKDERTRAYCLGMERAFLMLTGDDPEVLEEAIQQALQVRHEEQIAAEELL